MKRYLLCTLLLSGAALSCVRAQSLAGPVRVDLNIAEMQAPRVTEPEYRPWAVGLVPQASQTFGPVTVTLSAGGNGMLISHWAKAIVNGGAKLAGDGIQVQNFEGRARIEMRIGGLAPGKHTLLSFHNILNNPARYTFSPMNVTMNGKTVHENVAVPVRVTDNEQQLKLYTPFEVVPGEEAVFVFWAAESDATDRNVSLNGFEIDTPDANRQAIYPVPLNGDEHVDADSGSRTLTWQSAAEAVSHDVYVGTSREEVLRADRNSPEYKGKQAENTYTLNDIYSMDTYWWRIDEIDASGNVTPGKLWYFRPRQLAFEGAEGYGGYARGGRGGKVVHVTNLADERQNPPEGSLRWALQQYPGEPITIVFDVSGLIDLKERLVLNRPYVTIAGQTSPGKGICIRYRPFGLSGANDAIVRFVRVRVSNEFGTSDGMGMTGSNYSIIDHSSISWTTDEAFSSRGGFNITLQRTLISEALNMAGHRNYAAGSMHGYAASISGDIGSFHHNLLSHNYGRNWSLAGGLDGNGRYAGRLDIFDNVVYNWGTRTTDGGAHEVNFVNNYYKPGPATTFQLALNAQWDGFPGSQRYYTSGNIVEGIHENLENRFNGVFADPRNPDPWVDKPFFPSLAKIHTARDAYKLVLSDVGANVPLDEHDQRIIRETLDGSYTYTGSNGKVPGIPDHVNDVGGWENYPEEHRAADFDSDGDGMPDWWEALHGSNPNSPKGDFSESNADPDRDGYTALEGYLNWLAVPHFDLPARGTLNVNLAALALGFEKSPVFTRSAADNCKVKIDRKGQATVTAIDPGKPARLTFTVQDAEGTTMTRKVNFRIIK
jgi:hypothetical protein